MKQTGGKLMPLLALAALTCCALEQQPKQVSGSYYGEVGKRLLNTMQSLTTASLGSSIGSSATTAAAAADNDSNKTISGQVTAGSATSADSAGASEVAISSDQMATGKPSGGVQEELPNRNEFVKLDTAMLDSSSAVSESSSSSNPEESTSVNAASALPEDPTGSSAVGVAVDATEASTSESDTVGSAVEATPATAGDSASTTSDFVESTSPSIASTSTSATTTTTTAESTTSSQVAALPPEEAVRETELEAVAAVDASIGFGQNGDLFNSLQDACYDEYGNARYCEPPFENAAFERQVEVSSECGLPASRFCVSAHNHNQQNHPQQQQQQAVRNCHMCDANHPKKRHPASYLTDMNNSNNPTCWVSAPISSSGSIAAANVTTNTDQQQQQLKSDNVTLVLNLDKKYEITYISMQFCSVKPDSLAIYKSLDSGQRSGLWTPFQFYSSQCRRMYNKPASSTGTGAGTLGAFEAFCSNSSGSLSGANSNRIAFATLENRPGAHAIDRSPQLQDWMSASSIKVVLERHQPSWVLASQVSAAVRQSTALNSSSSTSSSSTGQVTSTTDTQSQADSQADSQLLSSPSDTYNYAISDLTVGGRCKCNGHASRCVHSKEGKLQCDCRHNTSGRDCERCAPFHFDRPWARATQLDANPCQPCNCNGHSRKCRFDPELYKHSGKRSGGVCINCRDNTIGRHCQYCRLGFTRDHSKLMSDKEACKHCDCHPIGSLGPVCNQTSGQCQCKEGVAGLQCNRCSPGYQQSSSLSEPCIKLPENDINYYEPSLRLNGDEQHAAQSEFQSPASATPTGDDEPSLVGTSASAGPQEDISLNSGSDKADEEGSEIAPSSSPRPPPPLIRPQHFEPNPRPHPPHWAVPQRKRRPPSPYRPQTVYVYGDDEQQQLLNQQQQRSRQQQQQPADNSLAAAADTFTDLDQRDYQPAAPYYKHPYNTYTYLEQPEAAYGTGQESNAARYAPGAHLRHKQVQTLMSANNEHSTAGDQQIFYEDDAASTYHQHAQPVVHYSEAAFNQIEQRAPTPVSGVHSHRRPRPQPHNRLPGQVMGYRMPALPPPAPPVVAPTTCADCQASTRRLSFRQFCHLDYAIKATILRIYMNDDWTRIEVEIQDIFKSTSNRNLPTTVLDSQSIGLSSGGANYLDNVLLSDEPTDQSALSSRTTNNQSSNVEENQQQLSADRHLRVGTKRSILLPTEDLTCKCPRLKTGTTYLLLGSIDAKEESELQLDRHGIALEWKAALQDRLVKYQRRQSRGRCT